MKTSWKTTTGGLLGMFATALAFLPDDAPGAMYLKPWIGVMTSLSTSFLIFARDNGVTSEQAGAKK